MKKKTIFHLTRFFDENNKGGIEEVIKQISLNTDFSHVVLSVGSKRKNKKVNKNLFSKSFTKSFEFLGDIFSYEKLKYIIDQKENIRLIQIHYPYILVFFYVFFLKRNTKVIVTHHSDIMRNKFFAYFLNKLRFFFNLYIDLYHVSTRTYFKDSEIRKYKKKVLIEFFSIKKNKYKIEEKRKNKKINFKNFFLFIGRNTYYKGFNLLEQIIKENPSINFVVVSKFKFSKKYKNLLTLQNISDNYKFLLFKLCRGVISTSTTRAESLGLSLVEGLSFGKPLIGFDIKSGINELILHNKNGYLIKNFNLDKYSNYLRKVIQEEKIYKRFCKRSEILFKKINNNYINLNKAYNEFLK